MAFISKTYQVFIASPGDVQEERDELRKLIWNWNNMHSATKNLVLLPVGWETHSMPLQGDRAQGIINDYVLKNCDVLIGVVWSRIGSPSGKSISGTVEEIDEFIESGKPVLLYKSAKPIDPDALDPRQYAKVQDFIERRKSDGIIHFYSHLIQFKEAVSSHLNILVNTHPNFQKEVDVLEVKKLKEDIHPVVIEIIKEAGKDPKAEIEIRNIVGNKQIITNGKTIYTAEASSMRKQAELIDIIEELNYSLGFVVQLYGTQEKELYKLTTRGFSYYDKLNSS